MLRSGPARSLARFTVRSTTSRASCKASTFVLPARKSPFVLVEGIKRPTSLALIAYRPLSTSLQRCATTTGGPPFVEPDKKELQHEKTVSKEELEPHPEEVSSESSVHQIFHEKGTPDEEKEEDMLAGVYSDLVGDLDTFRHGGIRCCVLTFLDRESLRKPLLSMRFLGKPCLWAWPASFLMQPPPYQQCI